MARKDVLQMFAFGFRELAVGICDVQQQGACGEVDAGHSLGHAWVAFPDLENMARIASSMCKVYAA